MKKITSLLACLVLVAGLISGCGTKENADISSYITNYDEAVSSYIDALDMEYAYKLTEKLAYDEELGGECGFRTAGSDYEHKAADFLADEMKSIGLSDIEKIPVTVDKWQFDSSSLTIAGTDISYVPASYAQSGTDADGITAEIVNVGTGFAEDYEGIDVSGKIVLAEIDQWNEAWIDGYLQEAALHGAAALVTYDGGGYAQASDDIRNIQDICTSDIMPTVSCSRTEGLAIAKAIKAGNNLCTLKVDNTIEPDKGTSYTVVGKIPGKSHDQQIIYAGHYDKYFYGFQDDSSAIGMIFTVAKAMLDSGYQPENDILIVCHGSEEWGAIGTQFDWATGAYETIHNAKPEWADSTKALFNFELCAYKGDEEDTGYVSCVPEYDSFALAFTEAYADSLNNGAWENGMTAGEHHPQTMEDGINYRMSGVPYLINSIDFADENGFAGQRYHTEYDDKSTWDEKVMEANARCYGGMGIVIDQSPALFVDNTAMVDWVENSFDKELAEEAGADSDAFLSRLSDLREYAADLTSRANDINARYAKAYASGDADKMASIRDEGTALNADILATFKTLQDCMLGIESSSAVVVRHEGYQNSIRLLDGALAGCETGVDWAEDGESGALDQLWQLNGALAYDAVIFSEENFNQTDSMYLDSAELFWATGKVIELADVSDAIIAINMNGDFDTAKPVIEKSRARMLEKLKEAVATEISGIDRILND